MGHNVGRLGNGLGCVPDRIYRGVSDWEDGVMWRPIETAPRDGTRCLFFQPANKGAGHPRARREDFVVDSFDKTWPRAHHQFPEAQYTHWMPLPEAPR